MATPFPFGSGNTLLASQLNAITTLATSTKTNSHTLTIADVGTRVIMNSASATTITVNTSIFGASDVVEILNIGAGVCTVTAGTCTVGTTGTLALAQNAGGILTFISASASVFRAGGVAATPSALVRIGGGALSGASTTFSSVFSATYDAYKIVLTNLLSSDHTYFQVGSATAAYYTSGAKVTYGGTQSANAFSNSGQFDRLGYSAGTNFFGATIELQNPFLAVETTAQYTFINTNPADGGAMMSGFLDTTASYTSIKIGASSGTLTGTCNIYGYTLS